MEFLPAIATVASNHHLSSHSHPSIGQCLSPARVAVNEGNACSARTSGADRSAIEASIITPGAVARTHGKRRARIAMIPPACRHGRTPAISRTEFMEYQRDGDGPYSALMFAVRMTLAHFSVSLARNFPNSAGEPGASTNPPRSKRRALMAESEIAKLTSLLSRSTTAAGVFFGAPKPSHELAS